MVGLMKTNTLTSLMLVIFSALSFPLLSEGGIDFQKRLPGQNGQFPSPHGVMMRT